ncbi:hypothetical protein DI383_14340 [Flavobacteriaceae bacterium LYZ1037]|nr:hypothetical protein DI383_14340 [Flavobacteriaceae bacterium LYZ1037]
MRKAFQILIILLILVSCFESKKEIITENRTLYVFDLDSLKRTENYKLTIKTKDSIVKYKYLNPNDDEKNITVRYNLNSKILSFAFGEFELTEKNKYSESELSKEQFDLFELIDSPTDGNGPMLFNKIYGILNIDNGWGMKFIYLKTEKNPKLTKDIINKLNE